MQELFPNEPFSYHLYGRRRASISVPTIKCYPRGTIDYTKWDPKFYQLNYHLLNELVSVCVLFQRIWRISCEEVIQFLFISFFSVSSVLFFFIFIYEYWVLFPLYLLWIKVIYATVLSIILNKCSIYFLLLFLDAAQLLIAVLGFPFKTTTKSVYSNILLMLHVAIPKFCLQ